ncbi:MAG TPA: hypothetical protein VMX33_10430 [bacterium]|nr:hypothetical protein [bacterium]
MMRSIKDTGDSGVGIRMAAAVVTSVMLAAIAAVALSRQPLIALRAFFLVPFLSASSFLSMLELSGPLALCALGVVVTFRAGHYSLGGEGQAYAGALAAAMVGTSATSIAGPSAMLLSLGAGLVAGGLVAALPAAGKRFANADVLLTSILVSQSVVFAVDWAIADPLRDPTGNLVAMRSIPAASLLHRLAPPSTLTIIPFATVVLCLIAAFYFEHTRSGAAHDLYGRNHQFAGLQGFNTRRLSWLPIVVAGSLHGLAGAAMALGARGTAIRGMSGGIGWSAIGAALVAGSRPSAVPLAALLFSWLDSGSRQAVVLSDLPPDAGLAIKAIVIIVISARPTMAGVRSACARAMSRLRPGRRQAGQ